MLPGNHARIHYGCEPVLVMLRWDLVDSHKRMHRIYKEEGHSLRHYRPRRSWNSVAGNRSRCPLHPIPGRP